MRQFLQFAQKHDPAVYETLSKAGGSQGAKSGSNEFKMAWWNLAKKDPQGFGKTQHDFIEKDLYLPQVNRLKSNLGIDVPKRSRALQEAVFSTAVQHRNNTPLIFEKALAGKDVRKLSDKEIIHQVYKERANHFPRLTPAERKAVKERLLREENEVLRLLP